MKCPRCPTSTMVEKERDGITLDVCPECRGVWLDRGELERLQARAVQEVEADLRAASRGGAPAASTVDAPGHPRRRDDDDDDDDDDDRDDHDRRRDHDRSRGHGRDGAAHVDAQPKKRRWFEVFDLFD